MSNVLFSLRAFLDGGAATFSESSRECGGPFLFCSAQFKVPRMSICCCHAFPCDKCLIAPKNICNISRCDNPSDDLNFPATMH